MRVNWLAIVVSAIVFYLFGWLWYTLLGAQWLDAMGTTREAMMAQASNPYPYIVSFVAAVFLAYGIARVLSWHAPVSAVRGAFIGFSMSFLFIVMALWITYAYEHRAIMLAAINCGYFCIGMTIQGAILGAWKSKTAAA